MGGLSHRRAPRVAALLVSSLAACAFDPGGGSGAPGDAGAGGGGGPDGGPIGAAPPVRDSGAAGCPVASDLLACLEFDGVAEDGSSYRNPIQVDGSPSYATGVEGGALDAGEGADLTISETSILDPSAALLIEVWLRPDSFPADGDRAGLVDNDNQWGLFAHAGGRVSCSMNGYLEVDALLTIGQWHHLACAYDGGAIRLFLDGAEVGQVAAGGSLPIGGTSGTAIGRNGPSGQYFDGQMDELLIWQRGTL